MECFTEYLSHLYSDTPTVYTSLQSRYNAFETLLGMSPADEDILVFWKNIVQSKSTTYQRQMRKVITHWYDFSHRVMPGEFLIKTTYGDYLPEQCFWHEVASITLPQDRLVAALLYHHGISFDNAMMAAYDDFAVISGHLVYTADQIPHILSATCYTWWQAWSVDRKSVSARNLLRMIFHEKFNATPAIMRRSFAINLLLEGECEENIRYRYAVSTNRTLRLLKRIIREHALSKLPANIFYHDAESVMVDGEILNFREHLFGGTLALSPLTVYVLCRDGDVWHFRHGNEAIPDGTKCILPVMTDAYCHLCWFRGERYDESV